MTASNDLMILRLDDPPIADTAVFGAADAASLAEPYRLPGADGICQRRQLSPPALRFC
jgi:hypothetical protein